MQQVIKSGRFEVRWNTAFEKVITECSQAPRKGQNGTWIHTDMINAYLRLHRSGWAHSVEVWQGTELVGGLYGVAINKVFCGESMFSKVPNTSKLALIALCQSDQFDLIDCQLHTPHLESMGAKFISRDAYMAILSG